MNADYMKTTLPFLVMEDIQEDIFGTRRRLVAAFADEDDAMQYVDYVTRGHHSVYKSTGEKIR